MASCLPSPHARAHARTRAGLDAARRLGLPISDTATLFSTPPDLGALEALLAAHPFPAQSCYIRRHHGFFIVGADVQAARAAFERLVVPHLQAAVQAPKAGAGQQQQQH
jgi:hypothetical protein